MSRGLSPSERLELGRLLAAHEPEGGEEASHLERIRAFVASRDDPFDRSIREGHLTCSAFVLEPAGTVLLTHHRRLGIWVQVGGHADDERRAHEVALREAVEESGLPDLAFLPSLAFEDGLPRLLDVDIHRISAGRGEPDHDHLDLRFVLTTREPQRFVANPRESRGLEWVTFEEARRRCTPDLFRALAKLERLASP